ncbi:MAG: OmpA family protein [Rikenellaceae bacterium]
MKKYIMGALALLVMTTAANAQAFTYESNEFQKGNLYVTAGGLLEVLSSEYAPTLQYAGQIGLGYWANPYFGLELSLLAGKNDFSESNEFSLYGANLSYLAYLYGGKSFHRFNIISDLGADFRYYDAKDGGVMGSYESIMAINGHLGIKFVYNISRRVSIYAEPMAVLQSKYYDVADNSALECVGMVAAGVTYTFNDRFVNMKRVPRYTKKERVLRYNAAEASTPEYKAAAADAAAAIKVLEKKDPAGDKQQSVRTSEKSTYVELIFAANSAKLSDNAKAEISRVGSWMSNNNVVARLVALSDAGMSKDEAKQLSEARAEAIKTLLVKTYKINANRIVVNTSDEAAVGNNSGATAIISFMIK